MSRVLLFSDLHLHSHKRSADRLADCLKALDWVFRTARDRGVDILFLGDLFHDRTRLDIQTLHRTHEIFEEYFGGPNASNLYLLLGNHDMWSRDKWDIYSPKVVSGWPTVHVIDRPQTLRFGRREIDFLPYTENPIADLGRLRETPAEILCAHIAVDGALLNSYGITADVCVEQDGEMQKLDVGFLAGWKRVFLGHYHAAQRLTETVEYVGSPLQLSFGESGQEKHLVLFDLETLETEYVVNDFSRRHVVTTPDRLPAHDLDDNFVIVKVDDLGRCDLADLRKEIHAKYRVASLEIRTNPPEEDEDVVVRAIARSDDNTLERWLLEKGPGDLDPAVLLRVGNRVKEAWECQS